MHQKRQKTYKFSMGCPNSTDLLSRTLPLLWPPITKHPHICIISSNGSYADSKSYRKMWLANCICLQTLKQCRKNYITTKRETLAMDYVLHKFRHYLLENKFVFYVNHMALLYLIKKRQLSSQIVRWLLFSRYDFSVVYKPMHFI